MVESAVSPGQPRADGNEGGNHPTGPGRAVQAGGPANAKVPRHVGEVAKKAGLPESSRGAG